MYMDTDFQIFLIIEFLRRLMCPGSTYSFKEHLYTGFYTDFIALYSGDLFNCDVL